jgi:Outer membrane protein beta-barrel domain
MKKLYLGTVLLSVVALTSNAQSFYAMRREKSLIFTVGGGTSTYFGELKSNGAMDKTLTFNAGLQYYLTNRISARTEFSYIQLGADDADSKDGSHRRRNLSFNSNNFEFNVTGAVNLFPNGNRYYRRPGFNLYGFGGIGALYFNPKAKLNGTNYALQPLATEGVKYSRFAFVIPFGVGGRIKVGPNVNVAIEGGYRKAFTDYLDDVSTVYVDPASLSSNEARSLANRYLKADGTPNPTAGAAGTKRGNPTAKDSYFTLSFKIEYYLPGDFGLGRGIMAFIESRGERPTTIAVAGIADNARVVATSEFNIFLSPEGIWRGCKSRNDIPGM